MQQIYPGISQHTAQQDNPVVPVHSKFAHKLFNLLLRAVAVVQSQSQAAFPAISRQVFKALAMVVCADEDESGFSPMAVVAAVMDAPGNGREKRRRIEATADCMADTRNFSCLDLFSRTFDDPKSAHAHRYIIQILRARSSVVLKQVISSPATDSEPQRFAKAAIDLGVAILKSEDSNTEGMFALIRDTIPLTPTASASSPATDLTDSVAQLCSALAQVFEPHVPGSLIQYCIQKKHRCYQWATMCRASTWLARSIDSDSPPAAVSIAIAQGSRLSWLQLLDPAEPEGDTQPAMWMLLVSESFCNINLQYPDTSGALVTPLYSSSLVTQSRVFSAVAVVLGKIAPMLLRLVQQQGTVLFVSRLLKSCGHAIRIIPKSGSSMGLFAPYGTGIFYGQQYDPKFDSLGGFIFRPPGPVPNAAEAGKPKLMPTDMEEQQREALEESETEGTLAKVFAAISLLATSVADADDSTRPLVVSALQTALDWIHSFAVAARLNAHRQEHILKNQAPVKIRVVGEHARPHRSATDWTRLQRVPAVHVGESTCKDAVAMVVCLMAAISGWLIVDDYELVLKRCLVVTSPAAVEAARTLHARLGADHFWRLSLSAMQALGSILGVPAYLSASDLDHIRLPQLHIRERSPRSSEALMIEALDTGIGKLLLDPHVLERFVECTRSGQILDRPEAVRMSQIWLDMIGTVFSHSLLRSRLGCLVATAASDPTRLEFEFWWLLALAASVRCLVDLASDPAVPAGQLRMASILLAHLTSWYSTLRADTDTMRHLIKQPFPEVPGSSPGFNKLTDWLRSFRHPDRPSPMVNIVYLLACKLPLSVELLRCTTEDSDVGTARVSRDIYGIANDSVLFLRRMLNHHVFSSDFTHPRLLAEYSTSLRCWLTSSNLPQRFSDAMKVLVSMADSTVVFAEDEADLVAIPDMDSENVGSEDDLVGQLLRDSTQPNTGATRKRPIHEYYTDQILGWLWTQYAGNLRGLAVPMVFGPRASTAGYTALASGTDTTHDDQAVLTNLAGKLVLLRSLYSQFMPYQHYIEAGCSLVCDDIAAYVPIHMLCSATASATAPRDGGSQSASLLDTCEFAALVLPDIADSRQDGNLDNLADTVETVARTLLAGTFDGSRQQRERCAGALGFFVWRQRRTILANLSTNLEVLEHNMGAELSAMRPHIPQLAAAVASTGADSNTIRLYGDDSGSMDNSVVTSLQLLTTVSPVFDAMLMGSFAESQKTSDGIRCVQLQCGAHPLVSLFRIFHLMVLSAKTTQL
ncbi:hypothetical protein EC988_002054, partial [Linderina pennispora]